MIGTSGTNCLVNPTIFSSLINLPSSQFNNATWYFEALFQLTGANADATVKLINSATATEAAVQSTSTNLVLVRSNAFTPNTAAKLKSVQVESATVVPVKFIEARLVCHQTNATRTMTWIPMSHFTWSSSGSSVAGSATAGVNPTFFTYEAANWAGGAISWYAQACINRGTTVGNTGAVYFLQVDDASYTSWATTQTIAVSTATGNRNVTFTTFAPIDGRHYRIASGGSLSTILKYRTGNIIADITNPTKFECFQSLVNYPTTASTGTMGLTQIDSSDFEGVYPNYKLRIHNGTSAGLAEITNPGGSVVSSAVGVANMSCGSTFRPGGTGLFSGVVRA
jgi:hypothetical protein